MSLESARQRQRNSTARCSFTSDFRRLANHQPRRRLAAQGHFRAVNPEHSRVAEGRGPGCDDPRPWKKPQFHQPPGLRLRQIDAVQTGFLSLAEFSECGGAVPCHVPGESGLLETVLQRALVSCASSQVVKRGLQVGPKAQTRGTASGRMPAAFHESLHTPSVRNQELGPACGCAFNALADESRPRSNLPVV